MTFALDLITSSGSVVEWSCPLMIGWIVIVVALSVMEVFRQSWNTLGPGQYRER